MSDRLIIICLTTSRPTAAGGSKQGLRIQLISLLLSWVGVKNVLVALKGLRLLVWKQLKHTSFQVMQIEAYIFVSWILDGGVCMSAFDATCKLCAVFLNALAQS